MVEVALNVAAEPIVTWSAYGTLLERQGNRGPNGAPQGVYACRGEEQWIAVSILTDDHWRSLCAALGDPAWARDSDLTTRAGRRARHDDVDRTRRGFAGTIVTRGRRLPLRACTAPVWDQNVQDELPRCSRGSPNGSTTQSLDGVGQQHGPAPQFEDATEHRPPSGSTAEVLCDQLLDRCRVAALVSRVRSATISHRWPELPPMRSSAPKRLRLEQGAEAAAARARAGAPGTYWRTVGTGGPIRRRLPRRRAASGWCRVRPCLYDRGPGLIDLAHEAPRLGKVKLTHDGIAIPHVAIGAERHTGVGVGDQIPRPWCETERCWRVSAPSRHIAELTVRLR